jgi:CheY-like chemotaxis protein
MLVSLNRSARRRCSRQFLVFWARRRPNPIRLSRSGDRPYRRREDYSFYWEDNAVNQKIASRFLEKEGHHVTLASDGRQALAAIERENFDVELMDVQMPEMDGFEATAAIRAQEQDTGKRLPIIAMTAHAMAGDRERCLAAGMDGYLPKPIDRQRLDQVLAVYADRCFSDVETTSGHESSLR